MPQQKKPVDDWQDVTDDWQDIPVTPTKSKQETSVTTPVTTAPTEKPSRYKAFWDSVSSYIPQSVKSGWNTATTPLSNYITSNGQKIFDPKAAADYYDVPSEKDWTIPFTGGATWKGLGAGMLEGAGNVVAGFTSPLNLATLGATKGASAIAETAPTIARGLSLVGKGLSAPVAAEGALNIADPNKSASERLFGIAELAGGVAGMRGSPSTKSEAPEVKILDKYKREPVKIPEKYDEFGNRIDDKYLDANQDPKIQEINQNIDKTIPASEAQPQAKFDPSTLEFADPKTGEIKPTALAKPGDVPLIPEAPANVAPNFPIKPPSETLPVKQRGRKNIILSENKPPTTAAEVTQSLSDRLQKVAEDPKSVDQPTEVGNINKEAKEVLKTANEEEKPGIIRQVLNANKSLLTSWDFSAPGRQGKAFILNKAWWTSLDDMFKAWGSKEGAQVVNQSIEEHPSGYFKPGESETGKPTPSFAEKVGLDLTHHEEMFSSKFTDKFERYTLVGKSSRAHTAFLNKLRSDQFVSMMDAAKEAGLDPENNLHIAKAYANFINSATGRGNLGKLQRNVGLLNDVFFAPKNMAGQIQTWNNVLNPIKYANYDPVLRTQALKSLFAIAGVGLGVGELSRMAGAQVSNNPTSADFRKIKIGDTRIDPFGGYQQYPVAAMKLLMGKSTSTISGKTTKLTGHKFGQQTRADVAETFFTNRLSPLGSFIWAWMSNKEFDGQPFSAKRAIFERVFPIAAKDIVDLAQADPALASVTAIPTMFGLTGTQHYTGR